MQSGETPTHIRQPPENRFVTVEGVRLRYWEGGSGDRVVILIHGVGSYVERWLPTFETLAEHMTVFAMDLPGRGLSDKPEDFSYHVSNLARMVKGFSDLMGLRSVSLVGSSLGGAIVAHFARQYPESVDRLVLSSSAGWGRAVTPALRVLGIPGLGAWIGTRQSRDSARLLLLTVVNDPSVVTDDLVDLHYRMSTLPGAWRGFLSLLRANGDLFGQSPTVYRPLRQDLKAFDKPVLIVWGERDRVIPPRHARIAASVLPRSETVTLEHCGHFLMLEKPKEYAELVLRFLDQPATGTRSSRSLSKSHR